MIKWNIDSLATIFISMQVYIYAKIVVVIKYEKIVWIEWNMSQTLYHHSIFYLCAGFDNLNFVES